jgi:hypothetical protein
MFIRRGTAPPPHATGPQPEISDSLHAAWHIYDAVADWTGKVDAKASYALTTESAVLAGAVALSQPGGRLSTPQVNPLTWVYGTGIALLAAAVLASVSVIMPRLTRGRRLRREWPSNYVYFGHLRYWRPQDLEQAMRQENILPVLARAVVAMSELTWRKHRCMQASLFLSALGSALIVLALLLSG